MPFDSHGWYPKKWREKIMGIIECNEQTAHDFVGALSWELRKFELQREEHIKRVQRAQFIKSAERLTGAADTIIGEIKYLQGSIKDGSPGSDLFFDTLSEARSKSMIKGSGRQFLGSLIVDLRSLVWAVNQGKESTMLSIEEKPKGEHEKPHRRSFAVEVANLFENILQEKPSSYCRQADGYMGKYAKVLDVCLSLVGDNQGLDSLVRYAVRHYKSRFQ